MSVVVGGIYVDRAVTRTANDVCSELRRLTARPDYYVDLCFMTYVQDGLGSEYAAGTGIRPGSVGRKRE